MNALKLFKTLLRIDWHLIVAISRKRLHCAFVIVNLNNRVVETVQMT